MQRTRCRFVIGAMTEGAGVFGLSAIAPKKR